MDGTLDVRLLRVSDSTICIGVAIRGGGGLEVLASPMWAADALFLCGSWASCFTYGIGGDLWKGLKLFNLRPTNNFWISLCTRLDGSQRSNVQMQWWQFRRWTQSLKTIAGFLWPSCDKRTDHRHCHVTTCDVTSTCLDSVTWHVSVVHLDNSGQQREERCAHVYGALIHDQNIDRLNKQQSTTH